MQKIVNIAEEKAGKEEEEERQAIENVENSEKLLRLTININSNQE